MNPNPASTRAITAVMALTLSCAPVLRGEDRDSLPADYCATRYPVVLVHGLGFRDDGAMVRYWDGIPDYLRRLGATVVLGNQQAFASHEENARLISRTIDTFIAANPGQRRVNIIAHSKGGRESRYLVARLDPGSRVASLTTIATPHRGSRIADLVMGRIPGDRAPVVAFINTVAKFLGDPAPGSYDAGLQLTTGYMDAFNRAIPDKEGVLYRSYAALIDSEYPNPVWRALCSTLERLDGPNDGLVSVRSARWGDFGGIIRHHEKAMVSHADVIGMHLLTGVTAFDSRRFFAELVHDLRVRGL